MTEGGFFDRKPISTTGLTIVIAMHAAVLTALALSKMEVPTPPIFTRLKVKMIPLPKDPPVAEPQEPKPLPKQTQTVTRPEPQVKTHPVDLTETVRRLDPPFFGDSEPLIIQEPPLPKDPPKPPVRVAAAIDPRVPLQPAYPSSEQRLGNEGAVVVRVLVGTDGRVKAVEKVTAASEAFFRSTERQALRYWRFKPATVDGRPVESWQVMTVRFELNA